MTTIPLALRRALGLCRRRPAHAVAVAVTGALVSCAAAIAFELYDATVLRPLPFPDEDRLVALYTLPPGMTDYRFRNPLHSLDLVRWRARRPDLAALGG